MNDKLYGVIADIEIMRGVNFGKDVNRTLNDALALLYERVPKVLSLEDAMRAKVCWIEKRHNPVVLPCQVKVYSKSDYTAFINKFLPYSNENISRDKYGVTWRCWNVEPSEDERKIAAWNRRANDGQETQEAAE